MSKNHAIKERQVNTVQHYLEREFPGQVRDTQWDRHRDMQVFEVVPPQLSQTSRPEASGARKPLRLQLAHPQRYVQTAHFRATPSCEPLRRAAAAKMPFKLPIRPVLTEWYVGALTQELANDLTSFYNDLTSFYVLTNARSKPLPQALNTTIGRNLVEAARRVGRGFVVVSRSDSTLRGHFPGELQALVDALAGRFDAWTIVPFFLEGGRYTINDVHYVAEGGRLTPVGETEFARDPSFGFSASNLRKWVEEKTGGRMLAKEVASISLCSPVTLLVRLPCQI